MGLISRLKRITIGKIESFLDSIEHPEVILPQLIEELQEKVRQAANAEAKALTAVKASHRKLDEASGRAERMRKGAELAISGADYDTARKAIAAQMEAEEQIARLTETVNTAELAHSAAREVRINLTGDLEILKIRKDEIIARARAAKQRVKLAQVTENNSQEILDIVARMEDKVVEKETEADVIDQVNRLLGTDIDKYAIDELQRNDEIQRRLDELKKGM